MTPASEPPDPRPSGLRWSLYRLVRPLLRPAAWRLRTFMTGRLHDELAVLRAEVAALRTEIAWRREQDEALEPRIRKVIDDAVLTLALDREAEG